MSGSYGEDIRDVKRPYRKKAFQTGYSQKGAAVSSTPLPAHTYSTATVQQTEAQRPGVDPHTFRRAVRPTPESLDGGTAIAGAFYPWHTSPKPESANLVQRQKVDLQATPLPQNNYIDAVVINVSDGSVGTTSWVAGVPTPTPFTGVAPAPQIAQNAGLITNTPGAPSSTTQAKTVSASTNPNSPQATGGTTFVPQGVPAGPAPQVNALITPGSNQEIYRVSTFGHSETAAGTAGVTYQIWVDGSLFMEWSDYQWSPITPRSYQWFFDNPIVVQQQIVYRVINETSGAISAAGEVAEAAFAGWTEQRFGYNDVGYTQLQS
tara:strand:- start:110 stop:1069 length:960 start_codon:yes stop_codon:yes gene_type:complete